MTPVQLSLDQAAPPKLSPQNARVLLVLQVELSNQFTAGWVSSVDIQHRARVVCHTKRIHELRQMGYEIEPRDEWGPGAKRTSFYRLVRP